jgi:uncharacterized OB-fold protein
VRRMRRQLAHPDIAAMTTPRPLPKPDADSEPFWAACGEGKLMAQRCPACGRFRWPPARFCPWCHKDGGDWTALPGTGVVRSFVVVDRAFDPAFEDKVPYVVANIALDGADDVVFIGNVIADPPDSVSIGDRVTVEFPQEGAAALPQFRPV